MAINRDQSSQDMLDELYGNDATPAPTTYPASGATAQADLQSLLGAGPIQIDPTLLSQGINLSGIGLGGSYMPEVGDGTIPGGATGTVFPSFNCPPGTVYDPELRQCIPEAATWRDRGPMNQNLSIT